MGSARSARSNSESFVRLSTKAGVFPRPLAIAEAFQVAEAWAQPAVVVVEPTARHVSVCLNLPQSAGIGGNLVKQRAPVALAIEHHGQIVSFNRDFGRLGGVRWEMPPALTWAPNRRKADGANPVAQERRTVGYRSPRKPGWRNWQTRGA